jgi:hypothetical protein
MIQALLSFKSIRRLLPYNPAPGSRLTAQVILTLFAVIACLGVSVPAHAIGQQIFDGPDGPVYATAVGADGTSYVGGNFTQWGPQTGAGAVLASTGSGTLNRNFPPVTGGIYAVAADGLGGWYIGGNFTDVAGIDRQNLAHILATGDLDPNWNPGANSYVYTLVVSGSTVYAGGIFTGAGGGVRYRLAAFDANGNLTSWNPGANGGVMALAVSGSTVYAGGNFTGAGGSFGTQATRNRLAAFDTSGNLTTWNPGANGTVRALVVSGLTVYAGGDFTQAGGLTRNYLAAFDGGGALTAWNPGANDAVRALAVIGGTVYAGGNFTGAGGSVGTQATRNRLAAFDTSGNLTTWDPGANNEVWSLAITGSTIYAGGYFTQAGGGDGTQATRNRLAAFDASGNVTPWNPGANRVVDALAVSGPLIYAGGLFTQAGGGTGTATRNSLAALDASGNLTTWNPGANGGVNALAVSGSTVYAGGWFTQVGGGSGSEATRNRLAAFDSSGAPTAWNPGANAEVRTLAVSGGTVYAGGDFTAVGGGDGIETSRFGLAAFDSSGNVTTWDARAIPVYALAVSGTTVYVGGGFTQAAGATTRNRLAAFDISGNLTSWNPGANGNVWALAVSGSTVYAGGDFTYAGNGTGTSYRPRIAAFDDGGNVTSWSPGVEGTTTPIVRAIMVSDATVYAAGAFMWAGGYGTGTQVVRKYLAAFDATGDVLPWNPGANGKVNAFAMYGSTVFAGGEFTQIGGTANGASAQYLARLPVSDRPSAPTNVSVVRGDASGTVSWTAPSVTGGSAIINYVLEVAPGPNYDT